MARPVAPAALALLPALAACGASVSKKYESDVRFERCLALDWQENVDARIRRRCWDEWVRHYAVGQTRDRIEYAKVQIADIDGRAEGAKAAQKTGALPEPTSAFQPVPMMATSTATPKATGAPTATPAARPGASALAPPIPADPCEQKCAKNLEGCLSGCKVPVCEQFCAQRHGQCVERCKVASER